MLIKCRKIKSFMQVFKKVSKLLLKKEQKYIAMIDKMQGRLLIKNDNSLCKSLKKLVKIITQLVVDEDNIFAELFVSSSSVFKF